MTDPTIASWSRESDLLFQLRQLREENARLREDQQGVDAVAVLTEEGWTWDGDQWQRPASPAAINMENFVGSGKPVVFNDLTSLKHKQTVGPIESAMRERVVTDANGRKYITTEPLPAKIIDYEAAYYALQKRIDALEAMLERQTARIVDLQTHIENFDGEDR